MILTIGCMLLAIGALCAVWLWMQRKRKTNLLRQEQLIREQIDILQDQIEESRRLRHDIANHIYLVEHLAKKKEGQTELLKNLKKYQDQLSADCRMLTKEEWTDNLLINASLRHKLQRCRDKGIRVENHIENFHVGEDIAQFDLLGLLYNILDNAMEACERLKPDQRFLSLSIKNEGPDLKIVCRNAKNPNIQLKSARTSKKDKAMHGYGREIIRAIVQKYHGHMQITEEADSYCIEAEIFCG